MPDLKVRGGAQHERNQERVWHETEKTIAVTGTTAPTKSYRENFENKDVAKKLESYINAIRATFPEQRAVGAIVAVNGRPIWMDRFANNTLFRRYWPKLLKSYAMEALTSDAGTSRHPTQDEAMRFAQARDGKMTYEVEEGVSKLIKIEADLHVIYELQDLAVSPPARLHESKMRKG